MLLFVELADVSSLGVIGLVTAAVIRMLSAVEIAMTISGVCDVPDL